MIAVLKRGTTPEQASHLLSWLKNMGLEVHISEGKEFTIFGLVGDTSRVDIDLLKSLEIVETVKRVSEPFKQANRKFHPADSVIDCGGIPIGGGNFAMIAGPCSVETEEQIVGVAQVQPKAAVQHKAQLLGDIDRADILTQRVGDAGFPGAAKLPLDLLLSAEHPARDLHTERIALDRKSVV